MGAGASQRKKPHGNGRAGSMGSREATEMGSFEALSKLGSDNNALGTILKAISTLQVGQQQLQQQVNALQFECAQLRAQLSCSTTGPMHAASERAAQHQTPNGFGCISYSALSPAPVSRTGQQASTSLQPTQATSATVSNPTVNPILLTNAASRADTTLVRSLLQTYGLNINAWDYNGWTPLYAAAVGGHTAVLQLLLDKGALPSLPASTGATPLQAAVQQNFVEVAKLLLDHGADVNEKGSGFDPPLLVAARSGYSAMAMLLLEHGADVNPSDGYGTCALHVAALACDPTVVSMLLDKGAPVDSTNSAGCTALLLVLRERRWQVAQQLLAAGANPQQRNARGETPLLLAAAGGCTTIVAALLLKGVDVNWASERRETALSLAVHNCRTAVVEMLLAAGADANFSNVDGATPLHRAAAYCAVDVVQQLLAAGAAVDAIDGEAMTPLHIVARFNLLDKARVLLKAGASAGLPRGPAGKSALHYAVEGHGALAMVEALLDAGADANLADASGRTPLHYAAAAGLVHTAALLLERGAMIDTLDHGSSTPLDVALATSHDDMAEALVRTRDQLAVARIAAAAAAQVFISFRVNEAAPEARSLRALLAVRGVAAFACDVVTRRDEDWGEAIALALKHCKVFVVLGTATYGERNSATGQSTAEELEAARQAGHVVVVARMAEELLSSTMVQLLSAYPDAVPWPEDNNVPEALVQDILAHLTRRPH